VETVDVGFDRHPRRHRDREPQVELVVALVVVRDTRVLVDEMRRFIETVGRDPHRDEHRTVPELARVEDRRELPDDLLGVAPVREALEHVVFCRVELLSERFERLWDERNLFLSEIEQIAIETFGKLLHGSIVPG
jgi:hypothetical protein